MSRCIVNFRKDKFCNIQAERMEEREGMIFVYDKENLVGIFDLAAIETLYLSKEVEKQ